MSGPEVLKVAQKVWKSLVEANRFERILQKVTIMAVGNGSCTAELKVEDEHTNQFGQLHGGCILALVDCITVLGLQSYGKEFYVGKKGVSTNISVNFLKVAALGTTVEINARTVKSGRTLAFLEAVLKNKDTGQIVAIGRQKYIEDVNGKVQINLVSDS